MQYHDFFETSCKAISNKLVLYQDSMKLNKHCEVVEIFI